MSFDFNVQGLNFCSIFRLFRRAILQTVGLWVAAILATLPAIASAIDDGKQMQNPLRVNYAGYLPDAAKTAIYLSENQGPIAWAVRGTSCKGTEDTYVKDDKSSGDSFYIIDFSACTEKGVALTLVVNKHQSAPFDISDDPYGKIKFEFFDYFRDHQAFATFTQGIGDWHKKLNISFNYVKDAGDNGVYPVNTAEASWALIHLLETYPQVNDYYSKNIAGGYTVYEQLKILTEQFNHVFDYGGKLAIAKFHTNVNDTWAACAPYKTGTCVSKPETKATFATARTLAAMTRLHAKYGSQKEAKNAYKRATIALRNAQKLPLTCLQASAFGGEGGMYPDNDNYNAYRNPEAARDNCHPGKDNTQDDEYAALVETYLAAVTLNKKFASRKLRKAVINNPRFAEASSFWWGAVAMEGNLSLLAHEAIHDIDLNTFKMNLLKKADAILRNQQQGYPGVTWDAHSNDWDSGDQDDVDNNVRWGSHRMALNDARILMAAAEIQTARNLIPSAKTYARGAISVLDHISGVNPINLAMYIAKGYPYIENAIERAHDGADNENQWPGKMVLGPNNWTNANDPDMPKFGSQPGLKMFAITGSGWASREVSIDANAALVPVVYFATERAPALFARTPDANTSAGTPAAKK